MIHEYHLICKDSLLLIDTFLNELRDHGGITKYFASVAKVVHFWRERVGLFIQKWESMHGVGLDVAYRRIPLCVVGGRWGSIDTAEEFFLTRSKSLLKPVLAAMLSKHIKAKPAKHDTVSKTKPTPTPSDNNKGDQAGADLHDLQDDLDSRAAYQIKMSKYISGASAAIHSDVWWLLLRVAHETRRPLRHFFAFAQKYSQRRMLFRLVTGKADEIMAEFDKSFLTLDEWFGKALLEAEVSLPTSLIATLRCLASKLVITQAGGFEMRIRAPTKLSFGVI